MPYRLRLGDKVEPVWHRTRDEALRQGLDRGWTIQGPPGCFTLAEGVELEQPSPRPGQPGSAGGSPRAGGWAGG